MKKKFGLIALIVVLATLLIGCSTAPCDICGKKPTKKYEYAGEEMRLCPSCNEGMKILDRLSDIG